MSFIEIIKSVNSQNLCEAFPNPVNADHCCNLQWWLTITQLPLPLILMATIVFVIILLLCFNDLNLWHVGVYFSPPLFQETSAGTRRTTKFANWAKENQHYRLLADLRYSSHTAFGGADPAHCNKRRISFCF